MDYIERKAALKEIDQSYGLYEASLRVSGIPTADVAPVRHGRWLPQVVLGQKAWYCSECKTLGSPHWKWCPVCGRKMDLEG